MQGDPSDDESVIEVPAVPWPKCTVLVQIKNVRNLSLKVQQHQVKAAIYRMMEFVKEKIIFDNAFPSLQLRNAWNRDGMVHACDQLGNVPQRRIQRMYDCIASRIGGDAYYLRAISLLVCIHPLIHHIISQSIYCRLMLELASFIVLQRWLQPTMSNLSASISIPASMSGRSTTFCIYSNTYIQLW